MGNGEERRCFYRDPKVAWDSGMDQCNDQTGARDALGEGIEGIPLLVENHLSHLEREGVVSLSLLIYPSSLAIHKKGGWGTPSPSLCFPSCLAKLSGYKTLERPRGVTASFEFVLSDLCR